MNKIITDTDDPFEIVRQLYGKLPFNLFMGLQISHIKANEAGYKFSMKKELIGNFTYGFLHGGVISAVLDATGGMTASASAVERMQDFSSNEIRNRIAQVGTIDIRVDYLRPGQGTRFFSTGTIMRAGKKVAVTRMELKNQEDLLIAVGTGTYIVG